MDKNRDVVISAVANAIVEYARDQWSQALPEQQKRDILVLAARTWREFADVVREKSLEEQRYAFYRLAELCLEELDAGSARRIYEWNPSAEDALRRILKFIRRALMI